jgi:hypothetical protein
MKGGPYKLSAIVALGFFFSPHVHADPFWGTKEACTALAIGRSYRSYIYIYIYISYTYTITPIIPLSLSSLLQLMSSSWQAPPLYNSPVTSERDATVDNASMITHSNDCYTCDFRLGYVPARDFENGALLSIFIEQVPSIRPLLSYPRGMTHLFTFPPHCLPYHRTTPHYPAQLLCRTTTRSSSTTISWIVVPSFHQC